MKKIILSSAIAIASLLATTTPINKIETTKTKELKKQIKILNNNVLIKTKDCFNSIQVKKSSDAWGDYFDKCLSDSAKTFDKIKKLKNESMKLISIEERNNVK